MAYVNVYLPLLSASALLMSLLALTLSVFLSFCFLSCKLRQGRTVLSVYNAHFFPQEKLQISRCVLYIKFFF